MSLLFRDMQRFVPFFVTGSLSDRTAVKDCSFLDFAVPSLPHLRQMVRQVVNKFPLPNRP